MLGLQRFDLDAYIRRISTINVTCSLVLRMSAIHTDVISYLFFLKILVNNVFK